MVAFDPAAAHQPISRKSLEVAAFSTIADW
jgi:hypothetical protein